MMKPTVIIYTDGSCKGTKGGWSASLYCNHESLNISGNCPDTTNNRMELQAVIEALALLTTTCVVHLHSDSKYVLDGMTTYARIWEKNNWRTGSGSPVANVDLWKRLLILSDCHTIHPHWVKGHNGDPFNETVDSLAQLAATKI